MSGALDAVPLPKREHRSDALARRSGGREEPQRWVAMDGVRGLAILMVIFWHYYACVPRPEWVTTIPVFERLAAYAWTGVPLFFVLSGFLIGRILIQQRDVAGYYRVFFLRRATRILPLFFVALVTFAVAREFLPSAQHPVLHRLFDTAAPGWSYPLFLQNVFMAQQGSLGGEWLSVTWSLAVEEQFYLLLPFLVAVVQPRLLTHVAVALVLFAVVFRGLALGSGLGTPTGVIVLLPSRIDAFAMGLLIATQLPRLVSATRSRWIAVGGLCACGIILELRYAESVVNSAVFYALITAPFALGLWHLTKSRSGRATRLLTIKPLVWLGSVSYFAYLFHQPVNYLTHFALRGEAPNLANPTALLVTGLAFGLLLAAGEMSRRWFESPIIAWGKRWKYGAPRLVPATAAREGI